MRVFIPLQRQPGLRVSGILFLNMLLPVIVDETRNSLWNAKLVRQRGCGIQALPRYCTWAELGAVTFMQWSSPRERRLSILSERSGRVEVKLALEIATQVAAGLQADEHLGASEGLRRNQIMTFQTPSKYRATTAHRTVATPSDRHANSMFAACPTSPPADASCRALRALGYGSATRTHARRFEDSKDLPWMRVTSGG